MQIFRVKQVLASDGVEIKRQGFFLVLYNWANRYSPREME